LNESGDRAPAEVTWATRWRDWGRRELSRRAYLVVAALFAAFAGFSLYKVFSPGHDGFLALLGLLGNLAFCGLMVAGYLGRRRRERRRGQSS
jgi:hypothetical protein